MKLIDKANQLSTSFSFINKLFESNKLRMSGGYGTATVDSRNFERIREMVKFAAIFYPDSWDFDLAFQFKGDPNANFTTEENLVENLQSVYIRGLIIHFPKVEIKNSRKETHEILDMYVRLKFYLRRGGSEEIGAGYILIIEDIEGYRSTLTTMEWRSSYSHSHLEGGKDSTESAEFRSFCLGSGEINIYRSQFNSTFTNQVSYIQSLLMQVQALVSWESLEGGPYKHMNNIMSSNSLTSEERINIHSRNMIRETPLVLSSLFETIKEVATRDKKRAPEIRYDTTKNKFYIVRDENTYNYFNIEFSQLPTILKQAGSVKRIFTKRFPDGKIEPLSSTGSETGLISSEIFFNSRKRSLITFRGVKIVSKILPLVDTESIREFTLDKIVVDMYLNSIEKDLNIQKSVTKYSSTN